MSGSVLASRARWSDQSFHAYRVCWWAGLVLMLFVNLVVAPRAEWVDRGKAIAAVRLGLKTPAYAPFSSAGEHVWPFGAVGRDSESVTAIGWSRSTAVRSPLTGPRASPRCPARTAFPCA